MSWKFWACTQGKLVQAKHGSESCKIKWVGVDPPPYDLHRGKCHERRAEHDRPWSGMKRARTRRGYRSRPVTSARAGSWGMPPPRCHAVIDICSSVVSERMAAPSKRHAPLRGRSGACGRDGRRRTVELQPRQIAAEGCSRNNLRPSM
jgi:hypothetical protein